VLDLRLEASLIPTKLGGAKGRSAFRLKLEGDMQRYAWNFDGVPYPRHPPLPLKRGERVELSYQKHHDDVGTPSTCTAIPIRWWASAAGDSRARCATRCWCRRGDRRVIFDADNTGNG